MRPEGGEGKYTLGRRAADSIKKFAGNRAIIFSFGGVLIMWMAVNAVPAAGAFDPYPFVLLNLVLSSAAIQTPLAMMSRNRQEELCDPETAKKFKARAIRPRLF